VTPKPPALVSGPQNVQAPQVSAPTPKANTKVVAIKAATQQKPKMKIITCSYKKVKRIVRGVNPKCPKGYTLYLKK